MKKLLKRTRDGIDIMKISKMFSYTTVNDPNILCKTAVITETSFNNILNHLLEEY